jgi:hypothetical protein
MKADDYASALGIAAPILKDATNETDPGALLLTAWAIPNMKWTDVAAAKDETSYALARKDSDEARGKRLCASGSLIQIEKQKTDIGKFFDGLLTTYSGNLFHFLAVGSTGTLVQNSNARFCGVVTGLYGYANSGGGVGHAVQIVGMFDLPENKAVAKAATAAPSPNGQDKRAVGGGGGTPRGDAQIGGTSATVPVNNAERVIAGLRAKFRSCYNSGLQSDPTMQGAVTVAAKIAPGGEVSSADIASNTGVSASVASCVAGAVRNATFEAPGGTGSMVSIPVRFVPAQSP